MEDRANTTEAVKQEESVRIAGSERTSEARFVSLHRSFSDTNQAFRDRWNAFVAEAEFGHIQQGYEHSALKAKLGWDVEFIWLEEGSHIVAGGVVLRKAEPVIGLSVAAIPCGPGWLPGRRGLIPHLLATIAEYCCQSRAVFCRFNLPCSMHEFAALHSLLPAGQKVWGHIWSYWNPPRAVALLDIAGTVEDVVNRMHKKVRRNYRRSQEFGVKVIEGDKKHIPLAVSLLEKTAGRKRLHVRDEAYFRSLFEAYPADRIALLIGEAEGRIAAFNLAVSLGDTASVLYGTLDYDKHRLFPSEAVEIAAIKWAQQRGCVRYDLGGMCTNWPPQQGDKGYGVWHYKKRFGARAVLLAPYCDMVFRAILYRGAWVGENVGLPLILEKGWGRFQVTYERVRQR